MGNWIIYNKKENIKQISETFNITPLTSVILCNRDVKNNEQIKKLLSSDINDLHHESRLPDIDLACDILYDYIKNGKSIRIVGDYDIDGVCSTYILYDAINNCGGKVSYDIPDRIQDGYGINISIIDKAIADKVDLILTCDNGIAANEQIKYAKEHNIKCIITDHHDIGELPKNADAIINPKRKDVKTLYPFTEICGTVVAWKFMMRFFDLYGKNINNNLNREYVVNNYLEFAMIATIGDIMPMTDENHIICKLGLRKILDTKNLGLKKLLEITNIDFNLKGINTYHIGFVIGPQINAAGRMDNATIALKLFLSKDVEESLSLANKMKQLNDDRKYITELGTKKAIEIITQKYEKDKVLVVYVDGLEEQVAGIVAGRLKEKYNKPVIILTNTIDEDVAKASCRSIDDYDIFEALNKHNDMYLKFGGHKLAAGFSIKKENIEILRELLNLETNLTEKNFIKKIYIDAEFPFFEFTDSICDDINKLEPYGQGFSRPIFATRDVKMNISNIYGNEKNVIKLVLEKNEKVCRGVMFANSDELIERLKNDSNVDILYYPKINEFNGYRNVEINLVDYR